jgi:hypothetical protein
VTRISGTYRNQQKLALVRKAIARGDQRTVRLEMGTWFKMLRDEDYGISDVAADALYGHADSRVWDLDPDAYPKPMIHVDIPSVEGRELCVNRASGLFVGFPLA